MTIEEAIDRIREAVEYYDMVHDTGEEKQTLKNKDYVLKGYYRLMEISNENKWSKKNNRIIYKNLKNAWPILQPASMGVSNWFEASKG